MATVRLSTRSTPSKTTPMPPRPITLRTSIPPSRPMNPGRAVGCKTGSTARLALAAKFAVRPCISDSERSCSMTSRRLGDSAGGDILVEPAIAPSADTSPSVSIRCRHEPQPLRWASRALCSSADITSSIMRASAASVGQSSTVNPLRHCGFLAGFEPSRGCGRCKGRRC